MMTSPRIAFAHSIAQRTPAAASHSDEPMPAGLDLARPAASAQDTGAAADTCNWFEALMTGPMRVARAALVERFEREYVSRLLASCNQNVAEAARRSGVNRATLFRIIRRTQLRQG